MAPIGTAGSKPKQRRGGLQPKLASSAPIPPAHSHLRVCGALGIARAIQGNATLRIVTAYRARAGHNVSLLVRGPHLRAIREHGLTVIRKASRAPLEDETGVA